MKVEVVINLAELSWLDEAITDIQNFIESLNDSYTEAEGVEFTHGYVGTNWDDEGNEAGTRLVYRYSVNVEPGEEANEPGI